MSQRYKLKYDTGVCSRSNTGLEERQGHISSERKRLEIVRGILKEQSLPGMGLPVKLAIDVEDADDCAVYDLPGNLSLLVGMDFVRGTGFKLFQEKYLNYFDIGYYLVVANLSDIAAMGGAPIGLTTVVRYPASLEDADFIQVIEGIKEAASYYHTPIVGGDIGGYEEMVLAASAFGIADRNTYLKRRGTLEGDVLCLTGSIGLASTALVYFTRARSGEFSLAEEEEQLLLNSWRRPVARIAEGLALARSGTVHACQDVSDGLKATIDQLGQASTISFEIYEAQLPVHPVTTKVASFLQVDPLAVALGASVDFQLLFTVAPQDLPIVEAALQALSCPCHVIGRTIAASETSRLLRRDGGISAIPGTAWDQQVEDVATVILEGR